jgi:hypothetical protein
MSSWQAVGCNRGDFKSKHIPVKLCPQTIPPSTSLEEEDGLVEVEDALQDILDARDQWARNVDLANPLLPPSETRMLEEHQSLLVQATDDGNIPQVIGPLAPLLQCVLSILWELMKSPSSATLVGEGTEVGKRIVHLLLPAAYFQAKTESVSIVLKPKNGKLLTKPIGPIDCSIIDMPTCIT